MPLITDLVQCSHKVTSIPDISHYGYDQCQNRFFWKKHGTHFSFIDTLPVIWGICHVSEIRDIHYPAQNRGYLF